MDNIAEMLRRINNLIRIGTIDAVKHSPARCRVKIGDNVTDWLPWSARRAGDSADWDPPTRGEQVLIFAPGGELTSAVVVAGIFSDQFPAPVTSEDVWHRKMPDGAVIEYNHKEKHLKAILPGTAEIQAEGGVTVTADVVIKGNLQVDGSAEISGSALTHRGKNVGDDHQHSGVETGAGNSGAPT